MTVSVYLSGTGTPSGSLGGAVSAKLATDELFSPTAHHHEYGAMLYRCVYVVTDADVVIEAYVKLDTDSAGTKVLLAWGGAVNEDAEAVASASVAPDGLVFLEYTEASPLDGGVWSAGDSRSLWIALQIDPETDPVDDQFTLTIDDSETVDLMEDDGEVMEDDDELMEAD